MRVQRPMRPRAVERAPHAGDLGAKSSAGARPNSQVGIMKRFVAICGLVVCAATIAGPSSAHGDVVPEMTGREPAPQTWMNVNDPQLATRCWWARRCYTRRYCAYRRRCRPYRKCVRQPRRYRRCRMVRRCRQVPRWTYRCHTRQHCRYVRLGGQTVRRCSPRRQCGRVQIVRNICKRQRVCRTYVKVERLCFYRQRCGPERHCYRRRFCRRHRVCR